VESPPSPAQIFSSSGAGWIKIPYELPQRFRSTAFLCRLRATKTLIRWADEPEDSNEDLRLFLHHSRLPDDALLLPCRETIFSVFRRGRRDSGVVSQRSQLRRQEHGVICNRALCLGPLFGRLAFRSQFSYKQLKALGIGGTVAVLMAKMQVEPHPFLAVPPLFTWNPPGREALGVSRISVRKSAHGLLLRRHYPGAGYSYIMPVIQQ
jgi:hypothetical protein